MLTDTTFWIDLLQERARGERGRASRFLSAHRPHSLKVSLVTWEELAEGVVDQTTLEHFLRHIHIVPMPRHVAWECSRIQRELAAAGRRLGENDAWIAATARAWGHRLVTRDGRFRDVPRLHTVAY